LVAGRDAADPEDSWLGRERGPKRDCLVVAWVERPAREACRAGGSSLESWGLSASPCFDQFERRIMQGVCQSRLVGGHWSGKRMME